MLHLFSGHVGDPNGLAAWLSTVGAHCVEVDLVNTSMPDQNVVDDAVWLRWRRRIMDGEFDVVCMGAVGGTFTLRRSGSTESPVLRSASFPYGFPKKMARERGLRPTDFETIRTENLLMERSAEAARLQLDGARAFVVMLPGPAKGFPHMFDLHSFENLRKRGARCLDLEVGVPGAEQPNHIRVLVAGLDERRSSLPAAIDNRWLAELCLTAVLGKDGESRDDHRAVS